MTTAEVMAALERRFCPPEYALIPSVRDATGFDGQRTADAVVMSTYPSRGLELIGIEVKASRTDWLRELRTPGKAEAVAKYMDRWYLAVGDRDIVRTGELPTKWGLIVPRGSEIIIEREAPRLKPAAIDRRFLAAVMRRIHACRPDRKAIEAAVKAVRDETARTEAEERQRRGEAAASRVNVLERAMAEFEAASGVKITGYTGARMGAAVRRVLEGGPDSDRDLKDRIRRMRLIAAGIVEQTTSLLEEAQEQPIDTAEATQPV